MHNGCCATEGQTTFKNIPEGFSKIYWANMEGFGFWKVSGWGQALQVSVGEDHSQNDGWPL
jgi:hypothetical protein